MSESQHAAPATVPADGHFVGRERELRLLGHLLDRSCAGQGQAVALTGAAGMGKTRTAMEVAALAQARGMAVRWGRCLEEPGAPPHWPWRQLIRAQWQALPDAPPLDDETRALVATVAPELRSHRGRAAQTPALGDEAGQRFAVYDAVAGFWSAASARQPCLLVLDDMHRADPGSLKLLEFLVADASQAALMVLVTCRDDAADLTPALVDTFAELSRAPHFRRLSLAGLSSEETLRFVGRSGIADAALSQAIHARTEGHPLYLVETVRLLAQAGGAVGASAGAGQALRGVPDGVRDVIAKRLAALQPSTARALTAAACIGRVFDLPLLEALQRESSQAALSEGLQEAVGARLVEPLARAAGWRFSHTLVRETLYERMAPSQRARLHGRIGELLEQRTDPDDGQRLAQLAHHFHEAGAEGKLEKAFFYAQQAAEHAARSLAHEHAALLYRRALSLQATLGHAEGPQHAWLWLRLGQVETAIGNGRAAATAFLQAAGLAQAAGAGETFALAAIGYEKACVIAADSSQQAVRLLQQALADEGHSGSLQVRLQAGLCRALLYSDQAPAAEQAYTAAVTLARQQADPAGLYVALSSFASAVFVPRLLPAALQGSIEAWQVLERAGRLAEASPENNAWLLFGMLRTGRVDDLARLLDTMLALAQHNRSPYHEAIVHCVAAQLALSRGEFETAERLAHLAHVAGHRVGAPQAGSAYGLQMFCIRREQGRLAEVEPVLQQMLESSAEGDFWRPGLALLQAELGYTDACRALYERLNWQATPSLRGDASTQTLLAFAAECCVHLDDSAGAARLLELLAPLAGTHFVADLAGPHLGSADRLLGMLATVCGRFDAAQQHFEKALIEDERCGARVWLAHGRYRLALMHVRRNHADDRAVARELLRSAHHDASELRMGALCARIDALAAQIGEGSPALPCGLTQREVEVLKLVAIGRNNRDVAAVLDISAHTVARHMHSILEKTYTANRTEAAAFAQRHGLVQGGA